MNARNRDQGAMTYSLLETVREHGQEQLAAAGRLDEARRRHADVALGFATGLEAAAFGPDEPAVAARLQAARADVVAAYEHLTGAGDQVGAARIAVGVHFAASIRGYSDLVDLAARSIDPEPGRLPPALAAEVAGAAADTALLRGDHDAASELVARAAAAAERAEDPLCAGRYAQGVAGDLALFHGRPDQARHHYALAASGFARDGRAALAAWLDGARALATGHFGDADAARATASTALDRAERTGCASAAAVCRYALAELTVAPDRARDLLRESVADADRVGASYVAGLARLSLATLAVRAGAEEEAVRLYRELVAGWLLAGNWTQQWNTLRTLVPALVGWGLPAAAVRLAAGIEAHAAAAAWGEDAVQLEAALAGARQRLGASDHEAALAAGRAVSRGRLVADVQEALTRLLPPG